MRQILGLIQKPSQYAGAEWGAVRKDPAAVAVRLGLAFPDLYEVGMSYLGQKILYGAVNAVPEYAAERVFAPANDAAEVMRARGVSLATLESDTPLAALDALGFHLTHELCYTNVLYMLDLAGIPLRAAERPDYPLVIAGGGCVGNAEPAAAFFDLMVLGDGEGIILAILEALQAAKQAGKSKAVLLEELARIQGVYVPAFYAPAPGGGGLVCDGRGPKRIDRATVADLNAAYFPLNQISPSGKAVHDRLTLEIARGCTRGCRFCQAGMIYRPVRERSVDALADMLAQGLAASGYEEVSFLSLSTGDFSALESLFSAIVPRCKADQVAVSLPSLRAGTLSPGIMAQIAGIRRTGATVAPEAGSERMRAVINKGISEADILAHARRLFDNGWQQIKLYFMIGLPGETDEDVTAIADLAVKVLALGTGVKRLQVTVAVSPFVPKAHTPFQWEPQIGLTEIQAKLALLRQVLARHKKIKLTHHMPEMSCLEGVFSRGGRELAPVIEQAYAAGAVFCSWTDHLRLDPWTKALEDHGLTLEGYLAGRDPLAPLPWDHLNTGVSKEFLLAERALAAKGAQTRDCRYHGCRGCGVCGGMGFTPGLPQPEEGIKPRLNRPVPQWISQEESPAGPGPAIGAPLSEDLARKDARLRVWYAKTGPAVYLSQLELTGIIERALRRAGIKPAFSSGFHPLPLLSFGWALPVGVASQAEWFCLFLRQALAPEPFCAALAPMLPPGMRVTGAKILPLTGKTALPEAEDFLVAPVPDGPDPAALWTAWESFLAAPHFPMTRMTAKGTRCDDVRPLVEHASPTATGEINVRFTWREKYLNPLKLAAAICGLEPKDISLVKTAQIFAPDADGPGEEYRM